MTGHQDSNFERIRPDCTMDYAIDHAALDAASRRWHNVTLTMMGTLADSGRATTSDDRRLFMAWQITRLLAPSWNEPPEWFLQRHTGCRNDVDDKGRRIESRRSGLWPRFAVMLDNRVVRVLIELLGHALLAVVPPPVVDIRQRGKKALGKDSGGSLRRCLNENAPEHSGHHDHGTRWPHEELDPSRIVLEAAAA